MENGNIDFYWLSTSLYTILAVFGFAGVGRANRKLAAEDTDFRFAPFYEEFFFFKLM